jgi:hypothetical protein
MYAHRLLPLPPRGLRCNADAALGRRFSVKQEIVHPVWIPKKGMKDQTMRRAGMMLLRRDGTESDGNYVIFNAFQ